MQVAMILTALYTNDMNKTDMSGHYIAPEVICIHYTFEGMLCGSPVDPGYGGNEDMEEGDEL